MRQSAARVLILAAVLGVTAGCTSTAVIHSSDVYYGAGPDPALDALHPDWIRPKDQVLAAMERAVALQELGYYEDSNHELELCLEELDEPDSDTVARLLVNDEAGAYRGELFERVYLHTLRVANHLALQDAAGAAETADALLSAVAAGPCAACRYPFSRWVAAVAFEATGDLDRAAETLAEAVAESPDLPFLQQELARIGQPAGAADLPGLAPPPPEHGGPRELVVLLLLGRSPVKVEHSVWVPPTHSLAWPRYVTMDPGRVLAARVEVGHVRRVEASPLTWMEDLARTSLKARLGALLAKETGKTLAQEAVLKGLEDDGEWELAVLGRVLFALADRADLRHWSALPGTCQALRVTIPTGLNRCELVYTGPDGREVEREVLELPEQWRGGPLFVIRRVP